MKADYHDPDVRRAIYDLYDTSFSQLSERTSISDRLGAVWHEVSTAFVAFEMSGRTLVLLDIVAPGPVPLDQLIPRIDQSFETVETTFTPDRVWSGPTALAPGDPDDCLMARGNLDLAAPCALSQLARC